MAFSFWFIVKEHKFSLQSTSPPIPKLPPESCAAHRKWKVCQNKHCGLHSAGGGTRLCGKECATGRQENGITSDEGHKMETQRRAGLPDSQKWDVLSKFTDQIPNNGPFQKAQTEGGGKAKQSKHTCGLICL